jgi:hypothetical protein
MSTLTTRNSLIKPDYTDAADVEDLNDNFDFIDGSIAPCEWAKAAAPTVDDDVTLGYVVGSLWFDTTNHRLYICEDNTDTKAVWRGFINASGTMPLLANWDVGAFKVSANQLESTVASGTAPFIVNSNTNVGNLNATSITGHVAADFLHANGSVDATGTINSTLADGGAAPVTVTSKTVCTNLNADLLDGREGTAYAILAGQAGGQTLYGGNATTENLTLYATSKDATGAIKLPNGGLEIGTKATTATYGAINIHEGAAGASNEISFLDGDGSTVRAAIYKDSGDTLILTAGTSYSAYVSGDTGKFIDDQGFMSTCTTTDPAANSSMFGATMRPTYTGAESVSETYYGVYDAIFPEIQAGHTNSGALYAYYTECMRSHHAADTDDDGTMTSMYGLRAAYGHYNSNAAMKGTTTNACGLYITPYCLTGTITNLIGVRIVTPSTGGTITNQWPIYSDWNAQHYFGGDIYTSGNCSALTFTDRTPHYDGDGIAAIKQMKGKDGKIDHDSLPAFAKKTIEGKPITIDKGKKLDEIGQEVSDIEVLGTEEETGRDLGATISILVKAVQQLSDKLDGMYEAHADAEKRMAVLEKRIAKLEK